MRYLAGNPIVITIPVAAVTSVHYRLYKSGTAVYDGYVTSLGTSVDVDLKELFPEFETLAGFVVCVLKTVAGNGTETTVQEFTVYAGGISKLLMRALDEAGTDIFTWKLKNAQTNFFLTTRTNDFTIYVPENEIRPLYYYAKGLKFDVKVDDVTVLHKDHTGDANESLQNIPFDELRVELVTSLNKLVSAFRIVTANGWSCSVVLTEAKRYTPYYITFRNSWNVWEKIALTDLVEYEPEFSESAKMQQFDSVVNDFINKTDRKEISNVYSASAGYRTNAERMFLLDMLQSAMVNLFANGRLYACNVSSSSNLFASTKGEPVEVLLRIELQDKDTRYSPILSEEEYTILTVEPDTEVTTDGDNILV
ncbi:MAG TPA: hypothetical protein VK152_06685 [Paludibacter sp.]|nr:hypothetical protein [Paludibacter sp.]